MPRAPVITIGQRRCLRQPINSATVLTGITSQSSNLWNRTSSATALIDTIGNRVRAMGATKQCTKHTPDNKIANLSREVELSMATIAL